MLCHWINKKAEMNFDQEDTDPQRRLNSPTVQMASDECVRDQKSVGNHALYANEPQAGNTELLVTQHNLQE